MREEAGRVRDDSPLVTLLYHLMMNHLDVGTVERLVDGIAGPPSLNGVYTRGWLARHAQDLADRLMGGPEPRSEPVPTHIKVESVSEPGFNIGLCVASSDTQKARKADWMLMPIDLQKRFTCPKCRKLVGWGELETEPSPQPADQAQLRPLPTDEGHILVHTLEEMDRPTWMRLCHVAHPSVYRSDFQWLKGQPSLCADVTCPACRRLAGWED